MRNLLQKHNHIIDQIHLATIGLAMMGDNLHLITSVEDKDHIIKYNTVLFTSYGTISKGKQLPVRLFNKVVFFDNETFDQVISDSYKLRMYLKEIGYE